MHHEKKLNMMFFVLNVMNMLHEKENLVSDKEEMICGIVQLLRI